MEEITETIEKYTLFSIMLYNINCSFKCNQLCKLTSPLPEKRDKAVNCEVQDPKHFNKGWWNSILLHIQWYTRKNIIPVQV